MPHIYFSINEHTDGSEHECCTQCGSVGVMHFEDSTMTPSMPHRCLRCDWRWDGCTFSTGSIPLERLNSILT